MKKFYFIALGAALLISACDKTPVETEPVNGTITIMGQVSFGDVTFTERDNGTLEIIVQNNGTTETVTVSVKYLGEGTCQLLAGSLQEGDILVYERQSGNPMMMMGF